MKHKRDIYTLIGFLLIATGLTSIFLNIVGVEWYLLSYLNKIGPLGSLLVKLFMIMFGFVLMYLNRVNWRED